MKQIRVAILGQGRSGRDIHGRHILTVPDMYKVVAIADPLEIRRDRAKNEYGCDVYPDYHSLMERADIDLIVNSTPSHLHAPITMEFLNKGFNVLCEKPLSNKVSDLDALVRASEKSGKVFAIFQQSRYAPYYRQVKKVVDSGVLGRILQVSIAFNGFSRRWDWQIFQEYNGGNLMNTGPHPLDQALQFIGTDIMPDVTCIMDKGHIFGDADDYTKLILRAPGRPVIDLEISSCCAYPSFTYNVQGTYGGLKGSMSHLDWKYYLPSEAPAQEIVRTPLMDKEGIPMYAFETLKWYEESWDVPKEQDDLMNAITSGYYNMLYRTLTEGKPLEVTHNEVRRQLSVIEECRRQNPLFGLSDFRE